MPFNQEVAFRQVIPGVGYQTPDLRMALRAYEYVSNQIPAIQREVTDARNAYDTFLATTERVETYEYLMTINGFARRLYGAEQKLEDFRIRRYQLAENVRAAAYAETLRTGIEPQIPNQIYDAYLRKIR